MCRGTKLSLSIFLLFLCVFCLLSSTSEAVELQNLELVFKKSYRWIGFPVDTLRAFGQCISTAGDVNGDGYEDIIVAAAWRDTVFPPWLSKAFIFFGGDPMDTIPDVILTGDHSGEGGFVEVCFAGDVNFDGYSDVVLSNHGMKGVRVFFGGNPMDTVYDVLLQNNIDYSFANSVAHARDVNGDGFDDIVVGDYMTGNLNGSVAIFLGGPTLDSLPDVILRGNRHEGFGTAVAGGGDVNCDGYDDIVVGEWDNSEFAPAAGKVYVFFGGDPMDTIPDVWMYGEGAGHSLGWSDMDIVNADTLCDWVVAGTQFYPGGFPGFFPGKVYVLFGDTLMDGIPDAEMVGTTDSTSLGTCSASAGRVAGTTFDGILSGAPIEYDFKGSAYLWLSSVPFDTVRDAIATGSFPQQGLGWLVASAGDVDGDGYDEIMFSNYAGDSMKTVWVCKYTGTGVQEEARARSKIRSPLLMQNSPNPFSHSTLIPFRVSRADAIGSSLDIYDAAGRHVRNLWSGNKDKIDTGGPTYTVTWDGRDGVGHIVPCGVYFCTLRAGELKQTRKMVLLR
ncbi:hypothetical protein E3J62_09135 [candidate division TA06 bacterium]|uniref:T9SS type A sorting domain-containing protein n=1 Tax=candidate division TA06 bacterium TaxID=2250710 RepID=A0A523UQQ6_UNCT6|nr:MAG: hypothetical protein E3J62_09135 [candidate division TA06 bacterium]